jgi:hypothetical protein
MTRIGDETVGRFAHGRRSSIGTTPVAIVATSMHLAKGIELRAADENTAALYVGGQGVTADAADATSGFPLVAGDSLFLPVDDPSVVYVVASAAGQKLFWFAI